MPRLRRLLLQWCPLGDLHLRGPCCCVRMNAAVGGQCRKGGLATASESRRRRARQRARCWQTDQVQCSERGGSTQRARTQRESERDAAKHLRAAGCDRSGRQSAARIRRIPSCLLRTHLGVSIGVHRHTNRSNSQHPAWHEHECASLAKRTHTPKWIFWYKPQALCT